MRIHTIKLYFILLLPVIPFLNACKKTQSQPPPLIDFSLNISGDTVVFTNLTTGASTYKWDFNDGTTSTDASPMHVYPHKGKYVPTLYATSADGIMAQGSTVIHIAKTSPIKLNDGTLSDWDTISVNVYTSGAGGGIFTMAKFDYDANYVYFLVEMNSTLAAGNIFDWYIDADNNAGTGLLTSLFPGGGYDELLEGQMLLNQVTAPVPVTPYAHTGAQTAFSFEAMGLSDFFTIGTVVQNGPLLEFEGSLDRGKLSLTGTTIRLGIVASTSGWAQVGTIPDQDTPSYILNMPE